MSNLNQSPELSLPTLSPGYAWTIVRGVVDAQDPEERSLILSLMEISNEGGHLIGSSPVKFFSSEMPPTWKVAREIERVAYNLLLSHTMAIADPSLDPFLGIYSFDAHTSLHEQ